MPLNRLILAVLLFCSLPAAAADFSAARLDRQAQAYFDQNYFNGSVLVAKDGKTLLAKGYGMANFEWNLPNAANTKFRLGSITKQFTSMVVMQLQEKRKLKVEDLISKYIDGAPDRWKAITIHHLLTHTSGVPNFTSFPDYVKTMVVPSPPSESLKRFIDKPLDFDPGTKWSYSNSGYILLGIIIEKTSGMKYEDCVRQNIFEPLGMKDSGYDWNGTVLANRASGYERGPKELRNASYIDMSIPHAAGALYSTAEDLKKWDEGLMTEKLLPKAALDKMFTPFKNNYAYGWSVEQKDGKQVISHGGGINGFATMIVRVPSERLLVVALANVLPGEPGKLADDLRKLALGIDVPVPAPRKEISLPTEVLDEYVGEYVLAPVFSITFTREGNQLMTQATGQGKLPIFAEAKDKFFLKVVDAQVTFERDSNGKVTGMVLHQGGREMPGKKKQ